jgi:hypothetical protein
MATDYMIPENNPFLRIVEKSSALLERLDVASREIEECVARIDAHGALFRAEFPELARTIDAVKLERQA